MTSNTTGLGCGETSLFHNVLKTNTSELLAKLIPSSAEEKTRGSCEVDYHQFHALTGSGGLVPLPRLIGLQASVSSEGVSPYYRCTMATVPQNIDRMNYVEWSPTLKLIKEEVEKVCGQKFNLCHILNYREGSDSMGFHSDTMLDLVPGSKIAVFSLGQERKLVLKPKDGSEGKKQSVILPDNSIFVLDEETNKRWVHGIRKTKDTSVGPRVAIVFRDSACFKRPGDGKLFGQATPFNTEAELDKSLSDKKFRTASTTAAGACGVATVAAMGPNSYGYIAFLACFAVLAIFIMNMLYDSTQEKNREEKLQEMCRKKNVEIWERKDLEKFVDK